MPVIPDPKVHSLMQSDVRTVGVGDTLSAVSRLFATHGFHHAPVLDGARVVGIVSAVDLAKASLERWVRDEATRQAWLDTVPVQDVMTPLPDLLHPNDPVQKAAERLGDGSFHALPVVDPQSHALVGILTTTDLVRFLHTQLRG